jgi:hypothetical protein
MAENPPKLTLIPAEPGPDPLQPPAGLQETGRGLWNRILRDFEVNDAHGREALFQICVASDRAQECAEAIARDGAVIRTKNGPRDHPALRHELQIRAFICRALSRMGFDVIQPRSEMGRPSGGGDFRG